MKESQGGNCSPAAARTIHTQSRSVCFQGERDRGRALRTLAGYSGSKLSCAEAGQPAVLSSTHLTECSCCLYQPHRRISLCTNPFKQPFSEVQQDPAPSDHRFDQISASKASGHQTRTDARICKLDLRSILRRSSFSRGCAFIHARLSPLLAAQTSLFRDHLDSVEPYQASTRHNRPASHWRAKPGRFQDAAPTTTTRQPLGGSNSQESQDFISALQLSSASWARTVQLISLLHPSHS